MHTMKNETIVLDSVGSKWQLRLGDNLTMRNHASEVLMKFASQLADILQSPKEAATLGTAISGLEMNKFAHYVQLTFIQGGETAEVLIDDTNAVQLVTEIRSRLS